MLVAHLPAGYLATRLLLRHSPGLGRFRRLCLAWGLFGSIAPDLDMFYFHLIDQRRHHHHSYFTHYPAVWIALTLAALLACRRSGGRTSAALLCFAANGTLHQLLDSVVGDIRWLAPWSERAFALATVPALYRPWWLNFVLHWSFGLELILVLGALAAFAADRAPKAAHEASASEPSRPAQSNASAAPRRYARASRAGHSQPATTEKGNIMANTSSTYVIDTIALILVIVGAINWGLVGVAQFDLVAALFNGQNSTASRIVYSLVGLAGLYSITLLIRRFSNH